MTNSLSYHPNSTPQVGETHEELRQLFIKTAVVMINFTPICREQSLAITHLEEALMWANKAVAIYQ